MAETVLVGCKMPTGLTLNLDRYVVIDERTGAVRRVPGKLPPVTLTGNAVIRAPNARGGGVLKQDPSLEGLGYVFTEVDKAFWEEWLATHADDTHLADGYLIGPGAPGVKSLKGAADSLAVSREREAIPGKDPPIDDPRKDPRTRALQVETSDEKRPSARAPIRLGAGAEAA
jgi:hypothetical protein